MWTLRLKKLRFISAVDAGAQGPIANVALLKRAPDGKQTVDITCKVTKTSDSLGLVFGWAMAGTLDGKTPHVDLQGDAIDVNSDEFLKVCSEFIEAGAAVDVMHNEEQDGRVVFAMPLTKEINDSLGIKSDVHGLAIAMKPSKETFAKFKSGELNAFSIGGEGFREPLEKAAVKKTALLTTDVEGHAHLLNDLDGGAGGLTESAVMGEGSDATWHSHPWIRNDNGELVIGTSAGHTHAIVNVNAVDETDDVELAAKSQKPKSPPVTQTAKVNTMSNEKNVEIEKKLERLERIAKMSGAHKTHFDALTADDQDSFLSLSAAARDSAIAAAIANDPVEVEFDGQQFRKSAGPVMINLAKTMKAQADVIAKQAAAIKKAAIRKEAAETIPNLPGADSVHDMIIAAIDAFDATPEEKAAMKEALKGANAIAATKSKAPGFGGTDPTLNSTDADDQLEELAKKHAAEHKVPFAKALSEVLKTEEGRALYAQQPAPISVA